MNYSKEEKEIVNMIKTGLEVSVEGQIIEQIHISRKEAKALLNLIQKQDKIIDKMAEQLEKCKNEIDVLSEGNIDCFIPNEYSNIDDCIKKSTCKECIKKYFKKEVEKDVKD